MVNEKILIVEDEALSAMDLKNKLEDLNYEVIKIVDNGKEAINITRDLKPDLVLMDIGLKGDMTGIEAGEKILDLNIFLIYLTGSADSETFENANLNPSYGYITKPYLINDLERIIRISFKRVEIEKQECNMESLNTTKILKDSNENYNVLVVDDDAITALDIKTNLEHLNYNVVSIEDNGDDAIKAAGKYQPDFILLDINIKGDKTGFDVAEEMNKLNIPVVYLSAYHDDSTVDSAVKTGPYGYIIKPFNKKEFEYTLSLAISKSLKDKSLKTV